MSALRTLVRQLLPQPLRQSVAQVRRSLKDVSQGTRFASGTMNTAQRANWHEVCRVTQTIQQTAHFEGKMINLHLAAARLDGLVVDGGRIASFWRITGKPSERNGFKTGRGIVNDQLQSDVGGGLCQIASLLYELGLRSGCDIVERFAHTRDLYTEANRFTPLGLDATVVWGFKDVRVRNSTDRPLVLGFAIEGHMITGIVHSPDPIEAFELSIKRWDLNGIRFADVTRSNSQTSRLASSDRYIIDPT